VAYALDKNSIDVVESLELEEGQEADAEAEVRMAQAVVRRVHGQVDID